LYSESVRDVAFESGAKWIKSIAETIIATQQSEIERLNNKIFSLINKLQKEEDINNKLVELNTSMKAELEEVRHSSEWQLCPKCFGEGIVQNVGTSSSIYRTCPVCNGNKTLIKPII
jgi:excinuclease UvrABC ATPase subunit